MQILQTLFGQRIAGLVILLVLLGAILLAGPSLGLSTETTYLVALGTAIVFAVAFATAQLRAAKSAAGLEQALRTQGMGKGGGLPGENLDDLRKQFDESLALLRQSRLGRGALYKLPWFVIIGPPGSGKTTLLRESGLSFPYMTKGRAAIRGLGGTKNCDWWFADRGVLLDTAGRYTSETDDRDEWLAFLDLLKKGRKKRPINGAIVAVSLEDVAFRSEAEVRKLADDVRDRIDELTRRLELVFPVYLVFTKCDGLLGFVESFSGLDKERRAQVWGFTFPDERPKDFDFATAFRHEFATLHEQLGKRRLGELAVESTRRRRQMVYRLPQEFAGVRDKLVHFVELIQQENPYQEVSAIRGCYFTSGTQERTALGDLLAEMARKSGVSADELEIPPGERKCYFVDDVFTRVVFDDGGLATPTRAAGRRRRALQWVWLGAAGALALALLWFAFGRFLDVATLTGRIREIVADANKTDAPYPERVRVLGDLAQLTRLADARGGDEVVHQELETLLLARLRADVVAPAAAELRRQLPAAAATELPDVANAPDLPAAAQQLAGARKAAEQRQAEAVAAFGAEHRVERARVAYDAWLQREVTGDPRTQQQALRLYEELLRAYGDREGAVLPFASELQQRGAEHATFLAALQQRERQLLERIEQQGGRTLAGAVQPAEPLQPQRLGCPSLQHATGIASTMVDHQSLVVAPAADGVAAPPSPRTLRDVRQDAQQRATELRALPIDPALQGQRDTAVAAAADKFERITLPDLVQAAWRDFLPGLELAEGLRQTAALAQGFDGVVGDARKLSNHFVTAANVADVPRAETRFAGLAALQQDVQAAAAAAAVGLGARIDALQRLANTAEQQQAQTAARWSAALRDRSAFADLLARMEDRLIDRVVVAVLESVLGELKQHYLAVRGDYEQLQRLFPFTADADDAPPDRFFALLAGLEALDRAATALPPLGRRWLGEQVQAQRVPEPSGAFAALLAQARAIWSCFDLQNRSMTMWWYLDIDSNTTGFKVLLDDKAIDEYSRTSFSSDRARAKKVTLAGEATLQLRVETTSGPFTLADLKLAVDDALKGRIQDGALPKGFWNVFRLCFAAQSGRQASTRKENLTDKHRVFTLDFQRAGPFNGNPVSTSLRLLLEGAGHRGEQLFSGPEAFRLAFAPAPPWQ